MSPWPPGDCVAAEGNVDPGGVGSDVDAPATVRATRGRRVSGSGEAHARGRQDVGIGTGGRSAERIGSQAGADRRGGVPGPPDEVIRGGSAGAARHSGGRAEPDPHPCRPANLSHEAATSGLREVLRSNPRLGREVRVADRFCSLRAAFSEWDAIGRVLQRPDGLL